MGWACGMAVDDCGNVFDCAAEGRTCGPFETCMGGITGPTMCVKGGTDCPLCDAIPDCSAEPQVTELKGRVITPGRSDGNTPNQVGVPNAFVYILREDDPSKLPAMTSGFPVGGTGCDRCEDQDLGPVLASAVTDARGEYTLRGNIPVGKQFVLVVKAGKFRRAQRYTVPASGACKTTQLPTAAASNPTRLPRKMDDGLRVNIPRVAVSTGYIDAMECVFEKMGIDHSEFTRPQLGGRIRLYRSNGAWPDAQSKACDGCTTTACRQTNCGGSGTAADRTSFLAAVNATALYASNASLSAYDMVVLDCEGTNFARSAEDAGRVREYVNRGGRLFASHLTYPWLRDSGDTTYTAANPILTGMAHAATWDTHTNLNSGTGKISLGRPRVSPRIDNFRDWMVRENVTSAPSYEFTLIEPRSNNTSLAASSEEFVHTIDGDKRVQQFSFDTPYGAPADATCGRVAYSGFHVAATAGGSLNTGTKYFPEYCSGNLSNQEKILLYALFDLGACVGGEPTPPACTPKACEPGFCGKQSDGCGGTLDCGCPSGQACINNKCAVPGCTPTTCKAEKAECGVIGDGCGGIEDCGPCPTGLTCGAEEPNKCGGGQTCPPLACEDVGAECGVIGDGCGGTVNCGPCPPGKACGIKTPFKCDAPPPCKPLTCAGVGAECGLIGDGCGARVDCGECPPGNVCGLEKPNKCAKDDGIR